MGAPRFDAWSRSHRSGLELRRARRWRQLGMGLLFAVAILSTGVVWPL